MQLTDAELAEGRRLLEIFKAYWPRKNGPFLSVREMSEALDSFDKIETKMGQWMIDHAAALLARPEEIAREAVREFADVLFSNRVEVEDGRCSVIYEWRLVKEAKERGVTLGDKP